MFRTIGAITSEILGKRCFSSLPSMSSPAAHPRMFKLSLDKHQCDLPLAAQQRCQHTVSNMTSFEKMKWDLGLYGKLRVSKHHLHLSGFRLYVCCTDMIDFPEFVGELKIPDSFASWFLVLQIHLWLVHVKLSQMGKEGLLLTQYLYKNMWLDVERRLNTFQELRSSERNAALREYHSIMCSSILHYDEGLLGSDAHLANALWIQLFNMDEKVDARSVELMVEYVRKQVHHLDNQGDELVMKPGYVSFLPLFGTAIEPGKQEKDLETLQKMSS